MLNSFEAYAAFLATLPERFASIQDIKFNAYRTSATRASSSGTIILAKDITLRFNEKINFAKKQLVDYGYVVYQATKSYTTTTPNHTRTIHLLLQLTHPTSTFLPISNIIAFQRLTWHLTVPT